MSAALYQPVYLLSILVIGFWMSFNRIYSPDCHLQEEGSHALFPFLFCLALAFWIGFLEAMMMGLPCISTAFEGAKELFGDSEACCLTPVGDENNLAKAMASVADDVVFRQRLACRGKSFADSFSMEKVIPQWLKVLFLFIPSRVLLYGSTACFRTTLFRQALR